MVKKTKIQLKGIFIAGLSGSQGQRLRSRVKGQGNPT